MSKGNTMTENEYQEILELINKLEKRIKRLTLMVSKGKLQVEIEQKYNQETLSIVYTSSRNASNNSIGVW